MTARSMSVRSGSKVKHKAIKIAATISHPNRLSRLQAMRPTNGAGSILLD